MTELILYLFVIYTQWGCLSLRSESVDDQEVGRLSQVIYRRFEEIETESANVNTGKIWRSVSDGTNIQGKKLWIMNL